MNKTLARDHAVLAFVAEYGIKISQLSTYTVVSNSSGQWGIFDIQSGSMIVPFEYNSIAGSSNYYWLKKDGHQKLVACHAGGIRILSDDFSARDNFGGKYSNLYLVAKNNKPEKGIYCPHEEKLIVPIEFDDVKEVVKSDYSESRVFYVTVANKVGVFSAKTQHCIVPIEYDDVEAVGKSELLYKVTQSGKVGIYSVKTKSLLVPIEFVDVHPHPANKNVWIVQGAEERCLLDHEHNQMNSGNVYGLYSSMRKEIIVPMEFCCPLYYDTRPEDQFSQIGVGKNEYMVMRSFETRTSDRSSSAVNLRGIYSVTKKRLIVPTNYSVVKKHAIGMYTGCLRDGDHNITSCSIYDGNGVLKSTSDFELSVRLSDTFWVMGKKWDEAVLLHLPTWKYHTVPVRGGSIAVLNDNLISGTFGSWYDLKHLIISLAGDAPVILMEADEKSVVAA